jgi:hypothetical protein
MRKLPFFTPSLNLGLFTIENYKSICFIQDNYPLQSIAEVFIIDFVCFVHRSMPSFSLGKLPMGGNLPKRAIKQ